MIKNILNSVFEKYKNAIIFNTLTDTRFTMGRYIRLVVDGDLTALKVFPLPIKADLKAVYANLMEEYTKLSENDEVIAERERQDSFAALCRKQNVLVWCIQILNIDPDNENVLKFLKKHRLTIDGLENEISVLNIRIDEQRKAFKKQTGDEPNKATKSDYYRMFTALEKAGYGEITEKTPVLKFIQANVLFRKEIDANNKQMEKLKNRK